MRPADFYVDLARRESQLLGIERGIVNAHGFAAYDCPPEVNHDLLLGGHLSDTLLKGQYAYRSSLRSLIKHPWREWRRRKQNTPTFIYKPETNRIRTLLKSSVCLQIDARVND